MGHENTVLEKIFLKKNYCLEDASKIFLKNPHYKVKSLLRTPWQFLDDPWK